MACDGRKISLKRWNKLPVANLVGEKSNGLSLEKALILNAPDLCTIECKISKHLTHSFVTIGLYVPFNRNEFEWTAFEFYDKPSCMDWEEKYKSLYLLKAFSVKKRYDVFFGFTSKQNCANILERQQNVTCLLDKDWFSNLKSFKDLKNCCVIKNVTHQNTQKEIFNTLRPQRFIDFDVCLGSCKAQEMATFVFIFFISFVCFFCCCRR